MIRLVIQRNGRRSGALAIMTDKNVSERRAENLKAMRSLGRDIFVPIALAILLSFVLAPLARGLENWHAPRAVSVISVVLLAFLVIFAIGSVIATQMTQLASDLPRYETNMRTKITSLRGS